MVPVWSVNVRRNQGLSLLRVNDVVLLILLVVLVSGGSNCPSGGSGGPAVVFAPLKVIEMSSGHS